MGHLGSPEPDEADIHHLSRVLRLRDGESVRVSDGQGGALRCAFRVKGGEAWLEPSGPVSRVERPVPEVAIAFPLLKGDRTSWAVQKLTELGVDRIVPLVAARSVVRPGTGSGADRPGSLDRLERIVRSASAQSRRSWLPQLSAPTTLSDLAKREPVRAAHPEGGRLRASGSLLAVGPEGGWEPSELELVHATVDLGPTVLRAETAAVTAAALLCGIRSGLVRPTTTGDG